MPEFFELDDPEDDEGGEENSKVVRAKWIMDGSATLTEAAARLQTYAKMLLELEQNGWQLMLPVDDDYGFVLRNQTGPDVASPTRAENVDTLEDDDPAAPKAYAREAHSRPLLLVSIEQHAPEYVESMIEAVAVEMGRREVSVLHKKVFCDKTEKECDTSFTIEGSGTDEDTDQEHLETHIALDDFDFGCQVISNFLEMRARQAKAARRAENKKAKLKAAGAVRGTAAEKKAKPESGTKVQKDLKPKKKDSGTKK